MRAAADGEHLPEGWLPAFRQGDVAAVLDGRTPLVLRAGKGNGHPEGAVQLRALTVALTAERRAALTAATRPVRR
jgi:hypothetical protein